MSIKIPQAATMSAARIGVEIEAGRLSPVDLTEYYLSQSEDAPNIYVRLTQKRARLEARAAQDRAQRGLRRHPLDGVPISWKDLFDIAGEPTQAGSKLLADRPSAATDAEVVQTASQAGLVCLGKTHLSELAFSGLGYNPMTATPPNIFDAARAPGGSSSGAAASVAFGLAAAGVGTDTGGSVRIPAAWNGLVGLKTTHGVLSLRGATPLSPSLDTIGPICRSVEDAGLLLSAMSGTHAPDLTHSNLAGRAFFVPKTIMMEGVAEDLIEAFDQTLSALSKAGAKIITGPAPELSEALDVAARYGAIVNTEGYAIWSSVIEAAPGLMHPLIIERFRSGAQFQADQIDFARLKFQELAQQWRARLASFDAALAPTTANHAPQIAQLAASDETYGRENLLSLRNTRLCNLLGLCALSLPTGLTKKGAPAALMAIGAPHDEALLLRIGAAIESALA